MDHSPRKCKICGKWHCLAGCVPIEQCYKEKEKQEVLNNETNNQTAHY